MRGSNASRTPEHAFLMLVLMLSMAGVPPFVGFWTKWSVLREVVAADFVWLAVVAVVFSVAGLFHYLRIAKLMYFDEPGEPTLAVANPIRLVISVNALSVFGGGPLLRRAPSLVPRRPYSGTKQVRRWRSPGGHRPGRLSSVGSPVPGDGARDCRGQPVAVLGGAPSSSSRAVAARRCSATRSLTTRFISPSAKRARARRISG